MEEKIKRRVLARTRTVGNAAHAVVPAGFILLHNVDAISHRIKGGHKVENM